jgi:biotin carboxyl carrier protein
MGMSHRTIWIEVEGRRRRVDLPADAQGAMEGSVDGVAVRADVHTVSSGELSLIVDGRQYRCLLDGEAIVIDGRRYGFAIDDPRSLRGRAGAAGGASGPRSVKAPMPGRVVRVLVSEGDEVAEHQGVVVIEAMKMQNELKSPRAGRVARVAVAVDATVDSGAVLVVIE